MEHVVASSLSKHRESNNVLYDLQYGLREKKSREAQVVQLVEELARTHHKVIKLTIHVSC